MQFAKFSEIRLQLGIEEDDVYFFAVDNKGTIVLRRKTEDLDREREQPGKQDSGASWAERLDL